MEFPYFFAKYGGQEDGTEKEPTKAVLDRTEAVLLLRDEDDGAEIDEQYKTLVLRALQGKES